MWFNSIKKRAIGPIFCFTAAGAFFGLPTNASAGNRIDDIELQWAVCEPTADSFLKKIGLNSEFKSTSTQTYFDTIDLRLLQSGMAARQTRKLHDMKSEYKTKVKIEFRSESEIDWKLIAQLGGSCEYDQYGTLSRPRCTIANKYATPDDPWSAEQEFIVQALRPGIKLEDLKSWGPFRVQEWSAELSKSGNELTISEMETRTGKLVEVSLRIPVENSDDLYSQFSSFFVSRGVCLARLQQGMFERVLASHPN